MSSCFVPGGRFGRTICAYVKKVDSMYLLVTWILSTGRRRVRDGYCCDLMLRRKTTVMDTAVP